MTFGAVALPADVERVVGRWSPHSLDRLGDGPAAARTVAVIAAPGLDEPPIRAALVAAGWVVRSVPAASAVLVLLDPDLPPGRALVDAARAVPAELPMVVRVADRGRGVLERWTALVPRIVPATPVTDHDDAVIAALIRIAEDGVGSDAGRAALDSALAAARSALTDAARRDSGSADLADARERRRRAATATTDDGVLLRRITAEVRLELAHRVGVHRRDTGARVSAAVGDASLAGLRRIPAAVAAEIEAASSRLADEVTAALVSVDAADSGPRVVRPSTTHQPPPTPRLGADDVLAGAIGASAGAGVGRVVVWAASLVGAWALVVTAVCAVVMATAVVRTRLLTTRRARMRRWAADVVADAAAGWERDTASRVMVADSWLTARSSARSRDAAARRHALIAEIDGEIRDITARAASRAAAYQRDLEVLERFDPALSERGTVTAGDASKHEAGTMSRNTGD